MTKREKTFEELLAASSFGTPAARRLRAMTSEEEVRKILERVDARRLAAKKTPPTKKEKSR
jgi:hypothetical protein